MTTKPSRRQFIKQSSVALSTLTIGSLLQSCMQQKDRPNILWLTSEDNSPFLGCYGDENANTPNLDKMASEGLLYKHAYANAPVCAPARSTIITGMYACSLGTHNMRSQYPLPKDFKFFTNYLREAGYYCTNNRKEDYNVARKPDGAWDESSNDATYLNRKEDQPFFAVFNSGISHESSLHTILPVKHDPQKMKLADYHPDHPEIRRDYAQYYDKITLLDTWVGEKLQELEDSGLAENTIVFYYADHGGILTRSKRFLYDSGTHVPMIIRFPKKYQHLAKAKRGSEIDRIVSFVDLAPTVLSLAGIAAPDHFQGHAFLGSLKTKDPDYTFMFRGRMDERIDMMRAVTDGRYRYIRNYMPHLIYGQQLNYLWRMRTTQVWEELYKQGKCNEAQSIFWNEKPAEELYDTMQDPHEVNNLTEDPQYTNILNKMSDVLDDWMIQINDTGFLPEAEMVERSGEGSVYAMTRDPQKYNQKALMKAARLASQRDPENLEKLGQLLDDDDSGIRYWGILGVLGLGDKAKPVFSKVKVLLNNDPSPTVKIVCAEILGKYDDPEKPLSVLKQMMNHPNEMVRLHAANVIDYLDETARPLLELMKSVIKNDKNYPQRVMQWVLKELGDYTYLFEKYPKVK